jgi:hypothetical protein
VGDEIVVERSDDFQENLLSAICRQLGLPEPVIAKKGITRRLLNDEVIIFLFLVFFTHLRY